jgi:hypothetical protein
LTELDKWKIEEYTAGMKITTESVLIITNDKGQVTAMVRKDNALQKNLIHKVGDASFLDIENLLGGVDVTASPQGEEGG